ncbi:cilia- and flagella-associated protein 58-like [Stegodyphus dumicola]|uniref:cilia- and flagella-associated protein 58-like n=1 Tax=Stegodyphus dumicola TaxID=202533 RepID=UPI0015AE36AE|nr:cilia- and flagella-associated protein 58-like [Stegodyphus dumicola]
MMEPAEKRKSHISPSENNIEDTHLLDKYYLNSIKSLMKDSAVAKHHKTLEEVQKYIAQVCERERKWSKKCSLLQSQLMENESKVKAAIRLSEEDKNIIDTLKNELEKAWKRLELKSAKERLHSNDEIPRKGSKNPGQEKSTQTKISFRNDSSIEKIQEEWKSEKRILEDELIKYKKLLEENALESEILKKDNEYYKESINEFKSLIIAKDEVIQQNIAELKRFEELQSIHKMEEKEKEKLIAEIESNKLQIFELEEELANKDKYVEELLVAVKQKSVESRIIELKHEQDTDYSENSKCNSNATLLKKFTAENGNLKRRLKELTSQYRAHELHLEQLKKDNMKLQNSLTDAERKTKLIEEALNEKAGTCIHLVSLLSQKDKEIEKLKIVLRDTDKLKDRYVNNIGLLEKKLHDMKLATFECNSYKESINSLNNEGLQKS